MANSYADDIQVKISEKYKPPFRISMPISYSQRLTINKQLQDNRPSYDFHLEKTVLDKVQEWKEMRRNVIVERTERVQQARQLFEEKLKQEKLENTEKEQAQAKQLEQSSKNINVESPAPLQLAKQPQNYAAHHQEAFKTNSGILTPTPVMSHLANANILKPVPLQNTSIEATKNSAKPFNISDFESDTSSPFDNMELKSINDLEALAQVLRSDQNNFQSNVYSQNTIATSVPCNFNQATKSYVPSNTKSYSNFSQIVSNNPLGAYNQPVSMSQDFRSYTHLNHGYSQVNTSIPQSANMYSNFYNPQSVPYNVPNTTSVYNNFNGYIYKNPAPVMGQLQSDSVYPSYSAVSQQNLQKTTCKSVPDLVKSLEKELENSHISEKAAALPTADAKLRNHSYKTNDVPLPVRPKSTDAVCSKTKIKDDAFRVFEKLSTEQREMCKGVSMMGFPLDRVARVCLIIGNDEKKLVDHLLALSDLLDLGFSEKSVIEALIKNNNDRDKALDLLIS